MSQDKRTKAQLLNIISEQAATIETRDRQRRNSNDALVAAENRTYHISQAATKFHSETIRYLEVKAALTMADIELRASLRDINRNTVALASKE